MLSQLGQHFFCQKPYLHHSMDSNQRPRRKRRAWRWTRTENTFPASQGFQGLVSEASGALNFPLAGASVALDPNGKYFPC